jgi:hypothetical protein
VYDKVFNHLGRCLGPLGASICTVRVVAQLPVIDIQKSKSSNYRICLGYVPTDLLRTFDDIYTLLLWALHPVDFMLVCTGLLSYAISSACNAGETVLVQFSSGPEGQKYQ